MFLYARLDFTQCVLPSLVCAQVIHEGPLAGMRTEKSDVSSASEGTEVGLKFSKDLDFELGDRVVCYRTFTVEQSIDWDLGF